MHAYIVKHWIIDFLSLWLQEMNGDVYSSLLKSLVMPDIGNISCYPVRISSAGAISALLEVVLASLALNHIFFKKKSLSNTWNYLHIYPCNSNSNIFLYFNLQNDYLPIEWLPLLQILVDNVGITKENESAVLFELLATTVEVGGEIVAMHIPMAVTALAGIIVKHLPPHPEPWPQVIFFI